MNTKTNIIQLERKTERWANRIREAHSKTVESIIETGRLLIEAKADCDHGEWGEITGETTGKPLLPFGWDNARRYMGEFNFSGQYQQNPMPKEGGVIKKNWLKFCDILNIFDVANLERRTAIIVY